jgi:protoheme IX farnesyltransferase
MLNKMSDASFVSASTAAAPTISQASAMDYVRLMKPRVMSLVVFTGFVGLVAAPVG